MDQGKIKNAEARVAELQSALDETQRILKGAEETQLAVERSAGALRVMAAVAIAAIVLLMGLRLLRRRHA